MLGSTRHAGHALLAQLQCRLPMVPLPSLLSKHPRTHPAPPNPPVPSPNQHLQHPHALL